VTLLGDAAHAMLPFLGMGAAMAIEDGMILARAMAQAGSVQAGFDTYEEMRRPRTALVHAKSAEQGRLTQAIDPDRYDGMNAPANDPGILAYDPVTAELPSV
jgi:salicylate hydroxylase